MQIIPILTVAGLVLLACWGVDKAFQKLFRSKAQHRSGKAVRASKRYGAIGVILIALGIGACFAELLIPGLLVAALGAGMCVYYLGFGIFYNDDSFLVSVPLKKSREYPYSAIRQQQLYLIAGGNTVVELHMESDATVSVQAFMEGAYPFLDHAFSRWCAQTGTAPESCGFHDPSQSCWFPPLEEKH
ncbi:MAG: hypothetical protein IJN47_07505 [Clostridia bacterium]|nr:hypothetical protein [Clostridia bacterium]